MAPKEVRVFKKLNTTGRMLEFLCKQAKTSKVPSEEASEAVEEMLNFPIKTEDEAKLIKDKFKDPTFFRKVVSISYAIR